MSAFIIENNSFRKLPEEVSKGSINDISMYLGYLPIQTTTFHGVLKSSNKISVVILEVFTVDIVAVLTNDNLDSISREDVDDFMKDFDSEHEYSSYSVQDILLEGIESKSFDLQFLSKVLEFEANDKNGEYFSEKIETHLFFINGYLASFQFGDELNKWARHIKSINPQIIANYAKEAKYYWGEDYERIFNEVNLQADAYVGTPEAYKNKFIKEHITDFENVDFVMLLVCYYDHKYSFDEFKIINHGRYKLSEIKLNYEVYVKGNFKYTFNKQGLMIKTEKK